ncbi:MAG: hypothetical protein JO332_08960, partial [Planctomycetaceae bacterium]|nr:hypothetical protein [Planctomycetaceae bacterium]
MGNARRFVNRTVLILLGFCTGTASAQESPAVPLERKIRLDLRSESWRPEGPFAISKELAAKLAEAGVRVVGGKIGKVDATLDVSWTETKGKEYKDLSGTDSLGFGSSLALHLSLVDAKENELLSLSVEAEPGDFIQKAPFDASLDILRDHAVYRHLEHFVAAALGVRSAFPKVLAALSWPDAHEVADKLLKASGYQPRTKGEEALLAVGHEDWDACLRLGDVARDPLLELFERQTRLPGGYDEKVLQTLLALGGPKVKEAFLRELAGKKDNVEVQLDEVLALIAALSKLGETQAIPVLEQLTQNDAEDVA